MGRTVGPGDPVGCRWGGGEGGVGSAPGAAPAARITASACLSAPPVAAEDGAEPPHGECVFGGWGRRLLCAGLDMCGHRGRGSAVSRWARGGHVAQDGFCPQRSAGRLSTSHDLSTCGVLVGVSFTVRKVTAVEGTFHCEPLGPRASPSAWVTSSV